MNNQMNSTLQKIPGIGDIPILGPAVQEQGGAEVAERAGG
jgi:Flp pilus assembly secretin CpaC